MSTFKSFLAICLASWLFVPGALAAWPERPVTLVVPFPAGGPTDTIARILADAMGKELGQPIVVDNRGGAGGNIGVEVASTAKPDGYTLLMVTQALVVFNPHLYAQMRHDPRRDLVPVANAFAADMVLIGRPGGPGNVSTLIAKARTKPGALSYGSAGNGTASHILMELFASQAQVDLLHVPYKGTAQVMNDLVAGRVDIAIDSVATAVGQIKAGKIEPIAVCGTARNALLPNVPTVAESGLPDYQAAAWFGVMAPRGTTQEIVDRLGRVVEQALKSAALLDRVSRLGVEPSYLSATDMGEKIRRESDLWGGIIRKARIKLD